VEIFLCPEGYKKSNLTDEGRCYTRDNAMKGSLTWAQHSSGQPHLIEGLQEQDVQGATSIDEDSVDLYVLDDGANYKRTLPWLWHKVWVVATVEGNGDLRSLKVLGVVGERAMTSQAVSFCCLLDSYESEPP
jgi:hypothetical protein